MLEYLRLHSPIKRQQVQSGEIRLRDWASDYETRADIVSWIRFTLGIRIYRMVILFALGAHHGDCS